MAQQRFDIKLGIQADVQQAKAQIQQLQKELSNLTQVKIQNGSLLPGLDEKSLGEANAQIAKLKVALNDAVNVKTGKLDLNQFETGLKRANLDVDTLAKTFQSMGPAGTAAFSDLAKAVASAEAPILRAGEGIRKFMTTFANSARYMVATRALNTFVGSIQSAINYAQDLNKSLNNIAIVTGASTDKMAEFAAQANKAAQRLSVTTTGYTDAALIYYQQGLSDQEVAARTETTMKMSNVTGESAQEVSSYMTAIWNNFYDGSESIETFADKITALGAATASSSQEIANGLQQFAAVGNTVGLSYDYAASALATIVAQTRQSESTVGNGLRTLFSRLQGLKLEGETEDGVSLNKYSAAVEQFGVQVLDQKGELREMDDILMDMGEKWQTLSRAQQVALAQTVGGVRQYTTLVALMDNFDKFKENLSITQGAEGTLQKQQEIYERSWEASRKRVQAAAQSIYQDIIDDKFFITLNDLFANFLKIVNQAIKGLGGVKGLLAGIASVAATIFGNEMAGKVDRFIISLKNFYQPERIQEQQQQWLKAFQDNFSGGGTTDFDKMTSSYATNALKEQVALKSEVLKLSRNLTDEQRKAAEMLYQQAAAAQDNVIEEAKRLQLIKQRNDLDSNILYNLRSIAKMAGSEDIDGIPEGLTEKDITKESVFAARDRMRQLSASQAAASVLSDTADKSSNIEEFQAKFKDFQATIGENVKFVERFNKVINNLDGSSIEKVREELKTLMYELDPSELVSGDSAEDNIVKLLWGIDESQLKPTLRRVVERIRAEAESAGNMVRFSAAAKTQTEGVKNSLTTLGTSVATFGNSLAEFSRYASATVTSITSLRNAFASLTDSDVSNWEKIVRLFTALGTVMSPFGIGGQLTQKFNEFSSLLEANENKKADFSKKDAIHSAAISEALSKRKDAKDADKKRKETARKAFDARRSEDMLLNETYLSEEEYKNALSKETDLEQDLFRKNDSLKKLEQSRATKLEEKIRQRADERRRNSFTQVGGPSTSIDTYDDYVKYLSINKEDAKAFGESEYNKWSRINTDYSKRESNLKPIFKPSEEISQFWKADDAAQVELKDAEIKELDVQIASARQEIALLQQDINEQHVRVVESKEKNDLTRNKFFEAKKDTEEAEIAAEGAEVAAEEAEEVSQKASDAAKAAGESAAEAGEGVLSFGGALLKTFGPMLKMAAILAAISAAVWLVQKAYEAWYATTREGQIEALNKEIQKLSSAIEATKTSISSIQESQDFLDGLVDKNAEVEASLQNLNKYSAQYKNIVREANDELVTTLKNLCLWRDAQIQINEETGLYEVTNQDELEKNLEDQKELLFLRKSFLEIENTSLEHEQDVLVNNYDALQEIKEASGYDYQARPDEGTYRIEFTDEQAMRATKIIDRYAKEALKGQGYNGDLNALAKDTYNLPKNFEQGVRDALADAGLDDTIVDGLFDKNGGTQLFSYLADIQSSLGGKDSEKAGVADSYLQILGKSPEDFSSSQKVELYDSYFEPLLDTNSIAVESIVQNNKEAVSDYLNMLGIRFDNMSEVLANPQDYVRGEEVKDWSTIQQMKAYADLFGYNYSAGNITDNKGQQISWDDAKVDALIEEISRLVTAAGTAFQLENNTDFQSTLNQMAVENLEKGGRGDTSLANTKEEQITATLGLTGDDQATQEKLEQTEAQVDSVIESLNAMTGAAEVSDEVIKAMAWDTQLSAEGISELSKNGEKWLKKIESNGAGAQKALKQLTESMTKALGLTDDLNALGVDIQKDFEGILGSEKYYDTVKKAINGDTTALRELKEVASSLMFEKTLEREDSPLRSFVGSEEEFETEKRKIIDAYKGLQQQVQENLNANPGVLSAKMKVDENFWNQLDYIVSRSAKSINEAQTILSSLNLSSADYDLVPEPVTDTNDWDVNFEYQDTKNKANNGKITGHGTFTQTATIWHPVPKGAAAAAASTLHKQGKGGGSSNPSNSAKSGTGVTYSDTHAEGWKSGYSAYEGENGQMVYVNNQRSADLWKEISTNWDKYNPGEVNTVDNGSEFDFAKLLGGGNTGSGGGGGGGGGSGGKEREQKAYEDEIERYHYLLKTIDAVNKKYDELENARKKAYGTDEIEIMDQEIKNLQEQIGLQKTYLDAISQDYLSDRAAIEAYGAQFDGNGNITNYEEIYRRQIDLVNSAAGDDEAADKAYEKFKKVLEQYEKTNELLQDTKLSYQELLDKATELNLEKITVSVDYNVAISDRDREYLEWLFDNMGDGIDKTADKINNLSKRMSTYAKDAQTYAQGINAIFEQVGVQDGLAQVMTKDLTEDELEALGLTKQQIEQIQEYTKNLRETQSAQKELTESGVEELKEAFSKWNEEIDGSIDRISSLNEGLEKYRDIIGLLDESIIGSTKALNEEIDAAERANNLKAIEGYQKKYEQSKQNLEQLNALHEAALANQDKVTAEALEDSIKEAEEAVIESHQSMLDATSEALSALESQWEATMERISKDFAQAMTGMNDISYFEDLYNKQKEMSDWYLDDYEKYFNLNKLVSRINKNLADDGSLAVQGKLNGLLGKVNGSLAEGAQISEATVGYYEKELDLIEAQMALEAARNAKSQVRMVRDNEGNMSYVYTADSSAVEDAEAQYQEKWYDLMQYTTEQQDELQEKMISSMQDFIDRAIEAAEKFGIGTDAYNEALTQLEQEFSITFKNIAGEMENSMGMFSHLYSNWWKDIENITQSQVASESDFKKSFGDTIIGGLLGLDTTEDWVKKMNEGVSGTVSELYNNGQKYVRNQEEVLTQANSSFGTFVDDTNAAVVDNQTMAEEEMAQLSKTIEDGAPTLGEAVSAMANFSDLWGEQMHNLTNNTAIATASLNDFYKAISEVKNIAASDGGILGGDFSMPETSPLTEAVTEAVSGNTFVADLDNTALVSNLMNAIGVSDFNQNVQIDVSFPNVTNHKEIELAFNNLILSAQQYANRK